MKAMSGLDRLLLNVESEQNPMDGAGIFLLDPSTAPDRHDYRRVKAELSARIPQIPAFTRRRIAAPFGAGHDQWVTDPDFSIDRHLKHVGAPAPHDLSSLCELTVSLLDEPLRHDRPLWQIYYVDGLKDGSAALILRIHHAAVDGVGGMEMLAQLFDHEPLAVDPTLSACSVDGERVPGQAEMLVRSIPDQVLTPVRVAYRGLLVAWPVVRGLTPRIARLLQRGTRHTSEGRATVESAKPPAAERNPGHTPRTLFNRQCTSPRRSLALLSIPIADVQRIKSRFDVTLNDVLLAMSSAAVADYLRGRDDLPPEPLRVVLPVNIRDEAAEEGVGNHFTFMMIAIPSDIADPVEHLLVVSDLVKKNMPQRITTSLSRRKATGEIVGSVNRMIDAVPGSTWHVLAHLLHTPVFAALPTVANYMVSDIPGPEQRLYLAGAEVTHIYGRSMAGVPIGLLIHCISYADSLDFGFTALAELVSDPQRMAEGVAHHFGLLLAAADGADKASAPTPEKSRSNRTSSRHAAQDQRIGESDGPYG